MVQKKAGGVYVILCPRGVPFLTEISKSTVEKGIMYKSKLSKIFIFFLALCQQILTMQYISTAILPRSAIQSSAGENVLETLRILLLEVKISKLFKIYPPSFLHIVLKNSSQQFMPFYMNCVIKHAKKGKCSYFILICTVRATKMSPL